MNELKEHLEGEIKVLEYQIGLWKDVQEEIGDVLDRYWQYIEGKIVGVLIVMRRMKAKLNHMEKGT